jgi:hypothetical protein
MHLWIKKKKKKKKKGHQLHTRLRGNSAAW